MKHEIKKILASMGYCTRPDFIIIGAQKAGTTALFDILDQHRLIRGAPVKEIHYFVNDEWYSENRLSQYHAYFPLPFEVPSDAKIFEATPVYLFHPEVAQRLKAYDPDLKLIVLLRNPIERAFSAWTMYHHVFQKGMYKDHHDPRSFTEAISEELDMIDQTSFHEDSVAYVKRGIYHYQIETYLEHFDRDRLLIVESNELKNNFDETSSRIQSFIGVPFENIPLKESNKRKVNDKNDYEADFLRLQEFYEPHNQKLFQLIGRAFDWNA